ncbi:MAG: NADPH:quinone oxidoreductase family protein [Acidobacteria bacterium]|nr:MAG: NADPH:quinone oxidoreductase family protein [Acidobacteriota bacterium]
MRAVQCIAYGSHESLVVRDVDTPEPGPGEVLVEIHAASLNFPDLLVIRGLYQFKPEPPFVPGVEAAGVVAALGPDVEGVSVGQRVTTVDVAGGFAEYRVVKADSIIPLPDDADFQIAAATTVTYGTSYHALVQRAHLAEGETLLVLGAAGGVGSAAVEIGKSIGATVIAAAGSDKKLSFCRNLGADHLVNYESEDLKSRVKELTNGNGVDVIYDPVGGDLSESAFRAIAWKGRHLVVGFSQGDIPRLPFNLPLLKGASIVGIFWGAFTTREPSVAAENLKIIGEMIVEGSLRPRISSVLPLDDVVDAYDLLVSRAVMGKVVLEIKK